MRPSDYFRLSQGPSRRAIIQIIPIFLLARGAKIKKRSIQAEHEHFIAESNLLTETCWC